MRFILLHAVVEILTHSHKVLFLICLSARHIWLDTIGDLGIHHGYHIFLGKATGHLLIPKFQTAEHLTRASFPKSGDEPKGNRGNSKFIEDESIPSPFRAKLQDYFKSGYDRGHMYVHYLKYSFRF